MTRNPRSLFNKQIHGVVGCTKEIMSSTKTHNFLAMMMLDVAKPYDKVKCLFLKLVVISGHEFSYCGMGNGFS